MNGLDKNWINVHTFDNSLENIFFCQYFPNKDDKLTLFKKLKNSIENVYAKNMIEIMINDFENNKVVIHNRVEQTDLLYEICMVYEKGDLTFFKEFEEQLSDIRLSGTCPSGRITRMIQVWRSMYGIVEDQEFRTKINKIQLVPISEDEKTEILKNMYHNYNSTVLKNIIKEYENGRLIYYDGIELWFLLTNFYIKKKECLQNWIQIIEKMDSDKTLNTKNLFVSILDNL